jgi:flagellar motor switch protein FliG
MDFRGIAHLLSQEHPQTIAVVLARLKSDQTSAVIPLLPRHLQGEVISRIATLKDIAPEVLAEIDDFIDSMLKPALGKFMRNG